MYDVLKASKGVPVNDIFATLWGRKLSGEYTIATYTGTLPAVLTGTKAGYLHRYKIYGNTEQVGTPTPENPIMLIGCGEKTENLVFTGWAEDFVTRAATDNAYITQVDGRTCLYVFCSVGYKEYDTKYMFKTDFKESTVYTLSFEYMRPSSFTISSTIQVRYTDGTTAQLTSYINDGNWHNLNYVTASGKTIKDICAYYSSGWVYINVNTFMVVEGSTAPTSYIPYGYKLPLTSAGQDVGIYIGDDTLSDEEYVDSGTGKIYRMVSGTLTPVDPPIPFPQIPTSADSTTISLAGEGLAPSEVEFEYEK
jgi:hypothetical protein